MKETLVRKIKDIPLKDPLLVEGLPGVGHVGKLVAEHMIEELHAEKIMEIYSPHFPPQVMVLEDGLIKQVRNEIYAYKGKEGEPDLLLLIGDYQSATNEGHYELTGIFLDIAESLGVKRIYALGGYGTGQFVDKPMVLGAANRIELVEEMKQHEVVFQENEPGGGIIGLRPLLGRRPLNVGRRLCVTSTTCDRLPRRLVFLRSLKIMLACRLRGSHKEMEKIVKLRR
jgi:uncharacterized protein (TIGR00162 family)